MERKHPAQKAAEQILKMFPQTVLWAARQVQNRALLPGCLLSSADVLNFAVTHEPKAMRNINALSALHNILTWRYGQSIYRFDPDLYREITDTRLENDIPPEAFLRLPSWGIYVETQGFPQEGSMQGHGFFVSLSDDRHFQGYGLELRLTYLEKGSGKLLTMPVPLTGGSVRDCLLALQASVARNAEAARENFAGVLDTELGENLEFNDNLVRDVAHCLALVLYLCSDQPDTEAPRTPALPKANRQGLVLPPADRPKVWDVGLRFGAAYRQHQAGLQRPGDAGNTGSHKRPHVRRAHWHGYWYGSKDAPAEREFRLRWLSPIMVGGSVNDLPATVYPVKKTS